VLDRVGFRLQVTVLFAWVFLLLVTLVLCCFFA